MFNLEYTNQFKKDLKLIKKRSEKDFEVVSDFLLNELSIKGHLLDKKFKPHILKGEYNGDWEAHIKPDLLVIWFEVDDKNIKLIRLGTHSDIF
ncbi:type II toxin-antitoxin system YafQ family toxin [Pedobacter sp. BS3]|uniref:type II toxin-antitoxin system RelE/ParE family toxin n=1 Tax=Pedobacter sp. BS3 TaxID=2567937 RepID=UPI0011EBEF52|nr:type II toxin-antitoxin system YafQ family toxin [Pedobacter sp. BS3]TZF83007.1 type II toxin-antitoxin system YafQ family toxin [Pedobacter sp. BS3]